MAPQFNLFKLAQRAIRDRRERQREQRELQERLAHIDLWESPENYDMGWILGENAREIGHLSPKKTDGPIGGLVIMPYPHGCNHVAFLVDYRNVGLLINLTKTPYDFDPFEKLGENGQEKLKCINIPFHDGEVPTFDQAIECVDAVEECIQSGKSVTIHCLMGLGRSGVMAACYLIRHRAMLAVEAIHHVRYRRPGAIVNVDQENFIKDFEMELAAQYLNHNVFSE